MTDFMEYGDTSIIEIGDGRFYDQRTQRFFHIDDSGNIVYESDDNKDKGSDERD